MGEIIEFKLPEKYEHYNQVWTCGCGGQLFHLLPDGRVVCKECDGWSTKLKVIATEEQ